MLIQVTYITQTTPELQPHHQPSQPRITYLTEPPPEQPVTYIQRVQSPRRPTVVYATKQPQQVMRPPPNRTVYVQQPHPPPQQTVFMQPPHPQPEPSLQPQFAYVPANNRRDYVDPNTVRYMFRNRLGVSLVFESILLPICLVCMVVSFWELIELN